MSTDTASQKYLDTLLQYYEEEVAGESYFYGLSRYFEQKDKLELLAKVERHAADCIEPLLTKYDLTPKPQEVLAMDSVPEIVQHAQWEWTQLVQHMVDRYPGYLDDFAALEDMAPAEDLGQLKKLTRHEVAAIEFARRELAEDTDSCAPLLLYLSN